MKSAFNKKWSDAEELKRKKENLDKNYSNNLNMFSPFSIFVESNNRKDSKNERISKTGKTDSL